MKEKKQKANKNFLLVKKLKKPTQHFYSRVASKNSPKQPLQARCPPLSPAALLASLRSIRRHPFMSVLRSSRARSSSAPVALLV